ncbi:nicastrin [Neocloeon triangulifer]|uniref:nicastrin n=1 Tax=Neocloeon triangulifer TaxID=2078957 RepID=UPI00286FA8FA|nr:nicastrin [Neocloeon triangulifer]
MHRLDFVLVFLLSAAFLLKGADATRTKDRIYANIEGTSACFRRMNGTHQFGCASQRTGNVGVLQVLNNQADVAWLVKEAPEDKYMAVVFSDMFTRQTLDALKESPKVNGVVLLRSDLEESSLASYSPEDQCPNRYSGLSSFSEQQCGQKESWNPKGNSLLLIDWGFPIFFVHNDTSIKKITDCFTKHNSVREGMAGRSLCAMEMQAFMIAAKDSETCIRRSNMINNLNPMRYCDPMGDRNVWATLFPREASEPDRSVIILAARLDTTSMFDGESPGAVSTVAGLVAALAAYDLLAHTDLQEADGNVMLMLFNGEAYDYIGSSRLLYDINNKMFPKKSANVPSMGTDKIRMVIELNQLSQINRTAGGKVAPMFFHKTAGNDINNDVATFINAMKKLQSTIPVSFLDSSASSLPPVSLQSFVKADSKLPGVAITDYDQSFTNNFYHSILDDSKLLGFSYLNGTTAAPDSIQTFLADLSTALGWSIYELMAKKPYSGTARVNSSMVDEMLHCYLNSINCTLMRQATNDDYTLFEYPPALYVGVTNGPNAATGLTGRLVALLTGKEVNVTKDKCKINETDLTHQYLWMRGNDDSSKGVCVQTTMNYSAASSPAFDIEGYDWKSGQFSTWTESVWKSFEVRIFLKPSYGHEAFVISFGSVFLLLSFIVVYFIYIQSDVFFDPNINNGGC